jgi:hypothetical protein
MSKETTRKTRTAKGPSSPSPRFFSDEAVRELLAHYGAATIPENSRSAIWAQISLGLGQAILLDGPGQVEEWKVCGVRLVFDREAQEVISVIPKAREESVKMAEECLLSLETRQRAVGKTLSGPMLSELLQDNLKMFRAWFNHEISALVESAEDALISLNAPKWMTEGERSLSCCNPEHGATGLSMASVRLGEMLTYVRALPIQKR